METIELETAIDQNGNVHFPEQYRQAYGKCVRVVATFEETLAPPRRSPGSAKGRLSIVTEDDEHLGDFNEYLT